MVSKLCHQIFPLSPFSRDRCSFSPSLPLSRFLKASISNLQIWFVVSHLWKDKTFRHLFIWQTSRLPICFWRLRFSTSKHNFLSRTIAMNEHSLKSEMSPYSCSTHLFSLTLFAHSLGILHCHWLRDKDFSSPALWCLGKILTNIVVTSLILDLPIL